jgi:uncharacterized protein (DUF169 family)
VKSNGNRYENSDKLCRSIRDAQKISQTQRITGCVPVCNKKRRDTGRHGSGAWSLGLREITESLKTGDFYYKLGKFESSAACKRTIDRVAHLHPGDTYATMYAPLEKTPFDPQVVVIVATPWAMLKLAQSTLFRLGGRIQSEFAGIQSVCADACAQTYLTGHVNFSLGCDGSRKFSGIEDGELVIGIPAELLPEISESLKIVAAAPGSKPGAK